jgi:hypothetical protein
VAVVLWLVTAGVAAGYLKRCRVAEVPCAQIPFLEESNTVEFKSSLRWDYKEQKSEPSFGKTGDQNRLSVFSILRPA